MEEQGRVFKYKLDFYYQQALIYLVTLILWVGIRGSFIEDTFAFVFRDPILYVIVLFVIFSFVALILNRIRDRKLIITENKVIFKNRFEERVIPLDDIDWVHIGRERRVQTGGRFQVIQMKLKARHRLMRIRVGRYDHEKELVTEMQRIANLRPLPTQGRRRGRTKGVSVERHPMSS
jgi:hypothetical protein